MMLLEILLPHPEQVSSKLVYRIFANSLTKSFSHISLIFQNLSNKIFLFQMISLRGKYGIESLNNKDVCERKLLVGEFLNIQYIVWFFPSRLVLLR